MAKVTIVLEDQGHGIEITTDYEPALGKEESIAQEVGAALVERVSEACKSMAVPQQRRNRLRHRVGSCPSSAGRHRVCEAQTRDRIPGWIR